MTQKHTPAPWKVVDNSDTKNGQIRVENYEGVIACCGKQTEIMPTLENMQANAHLIAAAPDLLEACKSILASFHESVKTDENISEFPELQKVALAIAKAEGRA
jgi:hypothetical protein